MSRNCGYILDLKLPVFALHGELLALQLILVARNEVLFAQPGILAAVSLPDVHLPIAAPSVVHYAFHCLVATVRLDGDVLHEKVSTHLGRQV